MVREDFNTAMTNRSLRTIKAELEFLADSNLITQQQLTSILAQLPSQPGASAASTPAVSTPLPTPAATTEKSSSYYAPTNQPPPAYPVAPAPPTALAYATALYTYTPTDTGDLALAPHDRIAVTEYMNAEWWKGRSERTGQEGIFPRSYVKPEDAGPPGGKNVSYGSKASSYGNVPLEVSQSGGGPVQRVESGGGASRMSTPGGEAGKKFGKKLGNAAVFGAGATIGGKIVNGIF